MCDISRLMSFDVQNNDIVISHIGPILCRFLFHFKVQKHQHFFITPISSSTPYLIYSKKILTKSLCHNVFLP